MKFAASCIFIILTMFVDISAFAYEIVYERGVKCIKETPKSYRVERSDGTTRLVSKGTIFELKVAASSR